MHCLHELVKTKEFFDNAKFLSKGLLREARQL